MRNRCYIIISNPVKFVSRLRLLGRLKLLGKETVHCVGSGTLRSEQWTTPEPAAARYDQENDGRICRVEGAGSCFP